MKKFSKFIICLLLCVFAFGVIGCKKKDNGFHPATEETVIGNGGMVVRKGDYVYFANGFQKVSSLTDDQRNSSFTKGGLYVAKLDSQGNFVRNNDGDLDGDYYRQVSTKLAGFDATDLYIFGDYIYFVSPSNENESGKIGKTEWAKERAVFYRVKLSNFDKPEEIYQANVKHENLSYQYYFANGKPYLLVNEKGDDLNGNGKTDMLYRVDVEAKKKKDKVQEVASNVSSIVFGYDSADNASNRIYFVEKKDSKYSLIRYNVADNSRTADTVMKNSSGDITVKFVAENYVYVTKTENGSTFLYGATIGGQFERMFDTSVVDDIFLLPEGNRVMATKGNSFLFVKKGSSLLGNKLEDNAGESSVTKINVIGFVNGCVVYYDNNNQLKTVSYSNWLNESIASAEPVVIGKIEFNADFIDLNGGDLYYCTGENNGYLYRINVTNNHGEEGEMVGVYLDGEKPTTDEE